MDCSFNPSSAQSLGCCSSSLSCPKTADLAQSGIWTCSLSASSLSAARPPFQARDDGPARELRVLQEEIQQGEDQRSALWSLPQGSILNPSDIDNCYDIGFPPIIYLVLVHVGLNVIGIVSRMYSWIKFMEINYRLKMFYKVTLSRIYSTFIKGL